MIDFCRFVLSQDSLLPVPGDTRASINVMNTVTAV